MHPQIKKLLFITALILSTLGAHPPKAIAVDDAIIAVVNDELLTLRDLQDYTHSTYVSLVAEGFDEKEIEKVMLDLEINGLNKLIEDKIILSHAKKVGLIVREKLIDDRLEQTKAKFPSEQAFEETMIQNGATITELRKKVRDQMMIKFIVQIEVRDKIFVNPQEVTNYYDKHQNEFENKEKLNLDSILIPWSENRDADRKKAQEALLRIKHGEDFLEVAKAYSKTPSIGTVERGQLMETIEKTIFNLKVGEVSDSLETTLGIYIFKVNGHKPAEKAKLSEVKDKIYNIIFETKFRDQFRQWLSKLKKQTYIEIKN